MIAMLPVRHCGALPLIACLDSLPTQTEMAEVKITPHITSAPLIPSRRNSSTVPTLCTFRATPAQALRMHNALRSCHSLAMHFAMFEGSDVEAFEPKIELDPVKREMGWKRPSVTYLFYPRRPKPTKSLCFWALIDLLRVPPTHCAERGVCRP
jgi:hypothetical protein